MDVSPQIFKAKVMHKRLFPKENSFIYKVYYCMMPIERMAHSMKHNGLPVNRAGTLSLHAEDHGARETNQAPQEWIHDILEQYGLDNKVSNVMLVAMPRIFGYVFNPVSFWLCLDEQGALRAVLCEVNNTFGETHSYLCAHPDHRVIHKNDWLHAEKMFHVSPFLEREGQYAFRFAYSEHAKTLGIWIDYYDAAGHKKLITSLIGETMPMTPAALRRTFWSHPLVTIKAIILIHWQAAKLMLKGIQYISRPTQLREKLSTTRNLTKM